MTIIALSKDHAITVQAGGHLFDLCESEDGNLYIEASNCGGLTVTVDDDDESPVTVDGLWLTVCPTKETKEEA